MKVSRTVGVLWMSSEDPIEIKWMKEINAFVIESFNSAESFGENGVVMVTIVN